MKIDVYEMTEGHIYWDPTIEMARRCSWGAGASLSRKMEANEFLPWERVFAAVENEKVVGYCTLTEKDELPEKYEFTPFVGFVFVDEESRGKRISQAMIQKCMEYAGQIGYKKMYIMSGEDGLYEKYGFVKLGDFETIYGSVDQLFVQDIGCIREAIEEE